MGIREQDLFRLAGMAHGLAIARAEYVIALAFKVDDGPAFGARLGLRDIPAFAGVCAVAYCAKFV